MRTLYFAAVVLSSSFFFFLFSSPNLSGGRLDVYHTSIHGVALVRIYNAGLKCAARGSLEIQDAKNQIMCQPVTKISKKYKIRVVTMRNAVTASPFNDYSPLTTSVAAEAVPKSHNMQHHRHQRNPTTRQSPMRRRH